MFYTLYKIFKIIRREIIRNANWNTWENIHDYFQGWWWEFLYFFWYSARSTAVRFALLDFTSRLVTSIVLTSIAMVLVVPFDPEGFLGVKDTLCPPPPVDDVPDLNVPANSCSKCPPIPYYIDMYWDLNGGASNTNSPDIKSLESDLKKGEETITAADQRTKSILYAASICVFTILVQAALGILVNNASKG